MDERYDMIRSVRDKRYLYVRNYMPHKIYGQHVAYMFQTPTTQVWKRLYDQGKLEPPKTHFWETKPAEELYDLQEDPDEVNNLANSAEHQEILRRLRQAQRDWAQDIRDLGFLPEGEIHSRSQGTTPYEMGRDKDRYPMAKIMAMAEMAASLKDGLLGQLTEGLTDDDSAVRYWAAMGLLMRGEVAREPLLAALEDSSPYVRIVAAETLSRYGDQSDLDRSLPVLVDLASVERHGLFVSIAALNALDELDEKAQSHRDAIARLPKKAPKTSPRQGFYVQGLIQRTLDTMSPR